MINVSPQMASQKGSVSAIRPNAASGTMPAAPMMADMTRTAFMGKLTTNVTVRQTMQRARHLFLDERH